MRRGRSAPPSPAPSRAKKWRPAASAGSGERHGARVMATSPAWTPDGAVSWVREDYDARGVETPEQEGGCARLRSPADVLDASRLTCNVRANDRRTVLSAGRRQHDGTRASAPGRLPVSGLRQLARRLLALSLQGARVRPGAAVRRFRARLDHVSNSIHRRSAQRSCRAATCVPSPVQLFWWPMKVLLEWAGPSRFAAERRTSRRSTPRRSVPHGHIVVISPRYAATEGLRKRTTVKPHLGATIIALRARAPLVPAAVHGSDRLARFRPLVVTSGAPIPSTTYKASNCATPPRSPRSV